MSKFFYFMRFRTYGVAKMFYPEICWSGVLVGLSYCLGVDEGAGYFYLIGFGELSVVSLIYI
jgi:hypothetical protein